MKTILDKLQQAWQSQCNKPLDVNPDQLLKTVRFERRAYFWTDVFVILVFLCLGAFNVWWAFRDIQKDWPWLISAMSDVWVAGYILFNRWRRRRDAAHYDEPLLAQVEWSIKDIEHQMWLDRNTVWWYILPLTLGCMIPPAISFAMMYGENPGLEAFVGLLFALLIVEGVFVAIFYSIHRSMKNWTRLGLERQRQELLALRALRETLLNAGE